MAAVDRYITDQGDVDALGTTVCISTLGLTYVTKLMFSNEDTIPYDIRVFKYDAENNNTKQLYSFDLNAGDIVEQYEAHSLKTGDYIIAYSSVSGTVFIVEATIIHLDDVS